MKKLLSVAFIFFSVIKLSFGQDNTADSLKAVLQNAAEDSNKVNTLIALSKSYYSTDPKLSVSYGEEAKKLADKIKFPKGAALALKSIGIAHYWNGNDVDAISNWEKALAVFDSIGDKIGVSNMYGNMGGVFFDRGDDAKALELHLKSLEYAEEVNDTFRIASALINIGTVYSNKPATQERALSYYERALTLSEYLGDQEAIGVTCVNLGEIYFLRNEDSIALKYFEKSLAAYKGSENIPYSLNYIGKVYAREGDYQKAIEYQKQAFDIAQKNDVKNDMTISLLGMASTYEQKGDTKYALQAYLQAEKIATEINASYKLEEAYRGLSLSYAKLGDINNAFKYQSLLIGIKDTIYNIEYDRKVSGLQFNYDLGKKQSEVDLLTKQQELDKANVKRQKLVRNVSLAGLVGIMIFAFIIFRNYRQKAKANKIISYQKGEIENLLLNILPVEVARELQQTGHATPKHYDSVSVLFTDFKGFTNIAEGLSPTELVSELGDFFEAFDKIIVKNNLEKIKTIGDSYMCAGGIPTANQTHPTDIVMAGLEIQEFINRRNEEEKNGKEHRWEIRIGIHTGPVVAGVVGSKKYAYDIWGDAVNTASRMESSGEPGKVNISGATYELVKDRFRCTHRGKIKAKNKGEIDMYFVENN